MNVRIFLVILSVVVGGQMVFADIAPVPSSRSVCCGSLETFTIHSPQLDRDMTVDVFLPDGYDSGRRYKVVYMHDGQNLFDVSAVWDNHAWEMDEAAMRLGADAPIIVGIYNDGVSRMSEYMPTEAMNIISADVLKRWLGDVCTGGFVGDRYVDFIAETLKPEIDSHYSTLTDVADTSVMGSSMGGLASMYALCRHPETFGAAACLSTHFIAISDDNEIFPTAFAAYLAGHLPMDGSHRVYFDTGDMTLDSLYVPHFRRIMTMLEQMGCTQSTLLHKVYPGHGHCEEDWASRVDIPLRFVLGVE